VEILFMAQRVYSELADDTMNKLAILAPGSARMQQLIAERLVNAGDLKGAIEHYRNALEIDSRLPGVRYELAEAILESDAANSAVQDEAEKEFNTVIATEGDSAKVQCELGRVASLRFNQEEAYARYSRAYSLNPRDADAQLGLGKVLMAMQKPREAIQYLRMAIRSDPLNDTAHYQLGLACRNLSMTDEAQKEMRMYQEIKQARDQVKKLYRQGNRRQSPEDEQPSTAK
jgi:predicted Zn-dependent protease